MNNKIPLLELKLVAVVVLVAEFSKNALMYTLYSDILGRKKGIIFGNIIVHVQQIIWLGALYCIIGPVDQIPNKKFNKKKKKKTRERKSKSLNPKNT